MTARRARNGEIKSKNRTVRCAGFSGKEKAGCPLGGEGGDQEKANRGIWPFREDGRGVIRRWRTIAEGLGNVKNQNTRGPNLRKKLTDFFNNVLPIHLN